MQVFSFFISRYFLVQFNVIEHRVQRYFLRYRKLVEPQHLKSEHINICFWTCQHINIFFKAYAPCDEWSLINHGHCRSSWSPVTSSFGKWFVGLSGAGSFWSIRRIPVLVFLYQEGPCTAITFQSRRGLRKLFVRTSLPVCRFVRILTFLHFLN